MKNLSWLGYALMVVVLGACGAKKQATETSDATRTAVSLKSKNLGTIKANLQKDMGRISNYARSMNVGAQSCPAGLDHECLDALYMALNNSRMIKSIATFSQARVGLVQNGVTRTLYNATATQASIGAGFVLRSSEFNQYDLQSVSAFSGGSGELFLSNAQPQAGIGLFVTLTNKTSLFGIAGGFAGADVTGWVEGAFYCYLDNTTGTPTGACAVVPVTSGGW